MGPTQTHTVERRRFLAFPWGDVLSICTSFLAMLILLHTEENWHGQREWARVKTEPAAKGESLDYNFFLKPPVPDAENVMTHPYMKRLSPDDLRKHFMKDNLIVLPASEFALFEEALQRLQSGLERV